MEKEHFSALLSASSRGSLVEVNRLLEHEQLPLERNDDGKNVLDLALKNKHYAVVDALLLKAATLSVDEQEELLRYAKHDSHANPRDLLAYTAKHRPSLIPKLVSALQAHYPEGIPASMLEKQSDYDTPLLILSQQSGTQEAIKALIGAGVDINAVNWLKQSTVHCLISSKSLSHLEDFLNLVDTLPTNQNINRENIIQAAESQRSQYGDKKHVPTPIQRAILLKAHLTHRPLPHN
jgi:ankyrin repeat protein